MNYAEDPSANYTPNSGLVRLFLKTLIDAHHMTCQDGLIVAASAARAIREFHTEFCPGDMQDAAFACIEDALLP